MVDSAGTAVAAPPPEGATAPSPASVADRTTAPSPAAADGAPRPEPPPRAQPFRVEPDARPLKPEPRHDVTPPRPRHPAANSFPAFGEFISSKATADADAARAKKVEEARAQGRPQISAAESVPPDPREGPEIVRLGRIPGGHGIRRV